MVRLIERSSGWGSRKRSNRIMISSEGFVRRWHSGMGCWVDQKTVTLPEHGNVRACVAILLMFGPPKPNDGARYICCHRDDDETNNHISNLYWGTYSDNGKDAVRNGRLIVWNA